MWKQKKRIIYSFQWSMFFSAAWFLYHLFSPSGSKKIYFIFFEFSNEQTDRTDFYKALNVSVNLWQSSFRFQQYDEYANDILLFDFFVSLSRSPTKAMHISLYYHYLNGQKMNVFHCIFDELFGIRWTRMKITLRTKETLIRI